MTFLTRAPERVAPLFGEAGDRGKRWVDALLFLFPTGVSKSYGMESKGHWCEHTINGFRRF